MERTNPLDKSSDKIIVLLLKTIPFLNEFKELVLIGGTAINFFLTHDYKRLSVDIDLVFHRSDIQNMSREKIEDTVANYLELIADKLLRTKLATKVIFNRKYNSIKVYGHDKTQIKIDISSNTVGLLESPKVRVLSNDIRNRFNLDCKILTASRDRIYAGKLLATIGRNTLKDSFDMGNIVKEGFDFNRIKRSLLYLLLNSGKHIEAIFNSELDRIPFNHQIQLKLLGSDNFSLEKHIVNRKKARDIVFELLNKKMCHYILASELGMIDRTDYAYRDYPGIINKNHYSLNFMSFNKEAHRRSIDKLMKLFKSYDLMGSKAKELLNAYVNNYNKE